MAILESLTFHKKQATWGIKGGNWQCSRAEVARWRVDVVIES